MKKIVVFIICTLFIMPIGLFSVSHAEEKVYTIIVEKKYEPYAKELANMLKKYPKEVDISDLVIKSGMTAKEFSDKVVSQVSKVDADMYGFASSYSIEYSQDNKKVKIKNIKYKDTYEQHMEAMREADSMSKLMPFDLSDAEKVLYIHNDLITNAQYKTDVWKKVRSMENINPDIPESKYFGPYGVLVDKSGVCESYTLAFNMIMKRIGIKSYRVSNNSMSHSWNIVQVNGKWYNIDLTWDDPVGIGEEQVSYNYFLKSDEKMYENSKKNKLNHKKADQITPLLNNGEWDNNVFGGEIVYKPYYNGKRFLYRVPTKLHKVDKTVDLYVYNVDKNSKKKLIEGVELENYWASMNRYFFKFDSKRRKLLVYKSDEFDNVIAKSKKIQDLKQVNIYNVDNKNIPINNYRIDSIEKNEENKNLKIHMLKIEDSMQGINNKKEIKYNKEQDMEMSVLAVKRNTESSVSNKIKLFFSWFF